MAHRSGENAAGDGRPARAEPPTRRTGQHPRTRLRGCVHAHPFAVRPAPLCIHGITFENRGSATGALERVWLNGPISANFHPNTNAQAVVANEIIAAFNTRYHTGIAPLTATEMLGGLLKKTRQRNRHVLRRVDDRLRPHRTCQLG